LEEEKQLLPNFVGRGKTANRSNVTGIADKRELHQPGDEIKGRRVDPATKFERELSDQRIRRGKKTGKAFG